MTTAGAEAEIQTQRSTNTDAIWTCLPPIIDLEDPARWVNSGRSVSDHFWVDPILLEITRVWGFSQIEQRWDVLPLMLPAYASSSLSSSSSSSSPMVTQKKKRRHTPQQRQQQQKRKHTMRHCHRGDKEGMCHNRRRWTVDEDAMVKSTLHRVALLREAGQFSGPNASRIAGWDIASHGLPSHRSADACRNRCKRIGVNLAFMQKDAHALIQQQGVVVSAASGNDRQGVVVATPVRSTASV